MSFNNLAGFPAFGPRVDTTIVYHPKTITFDPVEELPTSEPGTPQVTFTIEAADLPTFSPYPIPFAAAAAMVDRYAIYTIAGFQNTSGSNATTIPLAKTAATPTYTQLQSKSILAGNYITATFSRTLDSWDIGSTHQAKFYALSAGVKLRWVTMIILPRRIGGGLSGLAVRDLDIACANTSLIGAASVTSTCYYSTVQIAINYASPSGGTGTLLGGISNSLTQMAAMRLPLYSAGASTGFLCGAKSMADHAGTNETCTWGTAAASETKHHLQPYYPTRIAYTPIL